MRNDRKLHVVVAGESYRAVFPLVTKLVATNAFNVSVYGSRHADQIADYIAPDTDAVVLFLTDSDNVFELRELLSKFATQAFVLVDANNPPRAALARLADSFGAALARADEGPVIVTATLTSLLAQRVGGTASTARP